MSMLDERGGRTRADSGTADRAAGRDDRPTDPSPTPGSSSAGSPADSAAVERDGGVLVHRRRGALALVGTGALAVAVAYTYRAAGGGSALGYLLAVAMLPIAVVHLAAWWDARVPLLVADRTGLRLREGRRWTGLRWEEAGLLRLTPTRLPRRDGRLVVESGDGVSRSLPLALVDPADLRELPAALRALAGGRAEVVVDVRTPAPPPEPEPDAETDVETDVETDAETDVETVAETDVGTDAETGPGSATDTATDTATAAVPAPSFLPTQPRPAPTGSSPHPDVADNQSSRRRVASMLAPVRRGARNDRRAGARAVPAAGAARADVVHSQTGGDGQDVRTDRVEVGERPLRDAAPGRVGMVLELSGAAPAVTPVAEPTGARRAGAAGPARVPRPATEARSGTTPSAPVIGPQLSAARERVRLHVDDLAERTRIRPHVIEAIEVDDFSACGGDVYARGHLRALARAVGIEADPLVAAYDEHYASAPVSARRVFEAELAGAGRALRPTSGGPRWSVLVIVVLVLVLVWGLARLLVPPPADGNDRPDRPGQSVGGDAPHRDGSDAATAAQRFAGMGQRQPTTRIRLAAAPDAATSVPVVVRSADGSVVFRGTVGPDQPRTIRVVGAATVSTPDAGAVLARVDGRDQGLLGEPGEAVRTTVGG